jgi:hypothetical protein
MASWISVTLGIQADKKEGDCRQFIKAAAAAFMTQEPKKYKSCTCKGAKLGACHTALFRNSGGIWKVGDLRIGCYTVTCALCRDDTKENSTDF